MDFELPADIVAKIAEIDAFITREIKPLEQADDNGRFFDHRRYRITEGSEEIQIRRVAQYLFGFGKAKGRG